MVPGPASLSAGILMTCLWGVRELVPFLSSGSKDEFVENEFGAATKQLSDRAFDVLSRVLENQPYMCLLCFRRERQRSSVWSSSGLGECIVAAASSQRCCCLCTLPFVLWARALRGILVPLPSPRRAPACLVAAARCRCS